MIEHDACYECKYDHLTENDYPCKVCKGTVLPSSKEYDFRKDLYKPINTDLVHHPAHYCYSEYEPKDVIRAWGLNFNLGSAVKWVSHSSYSVFPPYHLNFIYFYHSSTSSKSSDLHIGQQPKVS